MRRAAASLVRARVWTACVACLLAASALAEDWTIQTVAVRDLREAQLIAGDLVDLGYDAYTEFTMSVEGLQYVRVRVGCFHERAGAESIAALLRTEVTREAVAVERTPGAPARGCLERQVGFVAPAELEQPLPGVPQFVVEVAGVRGVIRFLDGRWRVLQDPASEALPPLQADAPRYRQVTVGRIPYVRLRDEDGEIVVCRGRILAEAGDAVVVEDGGVVLACVWREPDEVGTS